MTFRASRIVGTGSYLPPLILTNQDLAARVDTTHDWIVERTGIHQRHIAGDDQDTSDLALAACRAALANAGLKAADIDGVIVATTSPDHPFPSVAVTVQSTLGVRCGPSFDVQAVCSGFIYGLTIADSLIRCGQGHRFLVVGAEKFSKLIDWDDRTTCVLFGDGAGAVILEASETPGILAARLCANGDHRDILYANPKTVMHGREVFKHAVTLMAGVVDDLLRDQGMAASRIDWLVPHQANARIIEGAARKLGLPMDRVIMTVDMHANTSAASIPLALDVAVRDGRIQPGHHVVLEALGAGLTWGAVLMRF